MAMRGYSLFMEKTKNEKAFNNEVDIKSLAFGVSLKCWGTVVRRLLERLGGYILEDIYLHILRRRLIHIKLIPK